MTTVNFDERARTWDDDPRKVQRANDIAACIARHVPLAPGMRGFEYGCGTGLVSFALADRLGEITMADSSTGMIDVLRGKIERYGPRANGRMQARLLDLAAGGLPGETWDVVYSAMTLHHIPDTAQILRQWHALLAPGGYLCIADLDAEDGSFHGPDVDVHHGFDRVALGELLRAAGYRDIVFDTALEMHHGARTYPVFLAVARA